MGLMLTHHLSDIHRKSRKKISRSSDIEIQHIYVPPHTFHFGEGEGYIEYDDEELSDDARECLKDALEVLFDGANS